MQSSTLQFLRNLEKNNNRDWFNENKTLYQEAQQDVISFVEKLIEEMADFDEEMGKLEAKKSVFRIYRDTRFSKDKTPYKTNFGAGLGMGKGNKISGYYLHIEPGKSFLAGGVYKPEPSVLKTIRQEISAFGDEFKAILEQDEFRNYFRGLSVEDKLKKVPQGFEKDDKMAEYLKLKHFIVTHPVSDEQLLSENAVKEFTEIFKAMKPLNDFLQTPFI
ncbi:DUF2461 domain-containing protein [Cloacibacterium caeni]|uniref:DUF2461 domain-containing protein n=1 Tax=Cloacibacterium caeni TaxID=2004710 RepID=UPI001BCFBBB1|nr:DUF2461 domain-containing protein [Cloacibacterium caeni]